VAAARSDELAEAGAEMVAGGLVEMAAAEAMGEASEALAAEGITQVAEGAAGIGTAEALRAAAEAVEEATD
jgi:hypothetical protein